MPPPHGALTSTSPVHSTPSTFHRHFRRHSTTATPFPLRLHHHTRWLLAACQFAGTLVFTLTCFRLPVARLSRAGPPLCSWTCSMHGDLTDCSNTYSHCCFQPSPFRLLAQFCRGSPALPLGLGRGFAYRARCARRTRAHGSFASCHRAVSALRRVRCYCAAPSPPPCHRAAFLERLVPSTEFAAPTGALTSRSAVVQ